MNSQVEYEVTIFCLNNIISKFITKSFTHVVDSLNNYEQSLLYNPEMKYYYSVRGIVNMEELNK